MIRFFLVLGLVAFTLATAAWMILSPGGALPSFFFQSLIFLLFGTGLVYVYLYRFNRPDFFVQLYLLTMAVKMLAYGGYNFFMVVEDRAGGAKNVIWFMLLYCIFTGLEIAFLYQKISRN